MYGYKTWVIQIFGEFYYFIVIHNTQQSFSLFLNLIELDDFTQVRQSPSMLTYPKKQANKRYNAINIIQRYGFRLSNEDLISKQNELNCHTDVNRITIAYYKIWLDSPLCFECTSTYGWISCLFSSLLSECVGRNASHTCKEFSQITSNADDSEACLDFILMS